MKNILERIHIATLDILASCGVRLHGKEILVQYNSKHMVFKIKEKNYGMLHLPVYTSYEGCQNYNQKYWEVRHDSIVIY